ncbi:MAG TPA: SPFH domain-containing protein [Gemmatimonadales bacterium]|jgi:regulator of protease activity HflC (stomatin/prohibitin superfamily)|nr:SPFH domain-containing protein [Gemmatimonadales bacterium]
MHDIEHKPVNGLLAVVIFLLAAAAVGALAVRGVAAGSPAWGIGGVALIVVLIFCLGGFFSVQPNQAKVLTLFGKYTGTVTSAGLWWANPFLAKRAISLRVRNFETAKLKVNDKASNPIEIGAIVVWQVVDTAEALFAVDNYEDYVRVQSESAVRTLASSYPYDAHADGERSLSHNAAEISDQMASEVQARLAKAGMKVLEARIAHLAYAPEIANAMLRRQQASAIIAARSLIVEGAVSMVDEALKSIVAKGIVTLDDERKAAMVSNLLVTLCADQPMQPVVNTGSLY